MDYLRITYLLLGLIIFLEQDLLCSEEFFFPAILLLICQCLM